MFNLKQRNCFKLLITSVILRSLASFNMTLIIISISSQPLLAATTDKALTPSSKSGTSNDSLDNSLNGIEILKKIQSNKSKITQLFKDVIDELKEYNITLDGLKSVIKEDTENTIRSFLKKTQGMKFEELKLQWQSKCKSQKSICIEFAKTVDSKHKDLNDLLFKLKIASTKIEDYLMEAHTQFQEYETLLPNLPPTTRVLVSSSINILKGLIGETVQKLEEKVDEQMAKADDLHQLFETFLRTKWSLVYNTKRVIDRFFLANDPLGESVFMLKKGTRGIIKVIKKRTFQEEENKFQNVYFLKVSFSDLCESAQDCSSEDLWVEYSPKFNLKLNKSVLFFNDKGLGVNLGEGDVIEVGNTMIINEDGVTAFTVESSLITDEIESSDQGKVFNNSFKVNGNIDQQDKSLVKNEESGENEINKRSLAEVEVPEESKAGRLITANNGFAVSCQEYIQKNNQFGTIGKAILKNINLNKTPILFDNDIGDLKTSPKKICPNYPEFSQAEKADFMVYYGAAIGMAESTCNSNIKSKGPHGILIGQWQLHLGKTKAYAGGICGNLNPANGAQNTVCGLKMLNFYTGMPKNTKKELFYSRNYWETMHYPRLGAKKALAMIRKFPGCF